MSEENTKSDTYKAQSHSHRFDEIHIKVVEDDQGDYFVEVLHDDTQVDVLSIGDWRQLVARVESSIKYITKEQA
jgi:hypothetical protein